jgi:hypothetical protein
MNWSPVGRSGPTFQTDIGKDVLEEADDDSCEA